MLLKLKGIFYFIFYIPHSNYYYVMVIIHAMYIVEKLLVLK